ncbi:MAG TPA: ribonuclease III [Leptolyngbyaceae cyanobacterium M65_K2018_010]|nr:ribonuclease III [Leptolyngbyaceae cyanobacterium M65_K2018_010]
MQLPNFKNQDLLQQALTHSSYVYENPQAGPDNERLEFLGDSVLEFVVRDLLFARYPDMAEGEMSKRCDRLVNQTSLAEIAVQLNLPSSLRLGSGAQAERHNPSVQADAFEALIGAYRLDAGLNPVYDYVAAIFAPLVAQVIALPPTDPVSALQEWVHGHIGPDAPEYRELREAGPDHGKTFEVAVCLGGKVYGKGQGRSKKEARKNAASQALINLQAFSPDQAVDQ